jgi:hypothetical protein
MLVPSRPARQLDQRHHQPAPAESAARDQVRERRPEQKDQHLCDRRGLDADDERVGHDWARQLVEQLARRHAQEDRRDRQHEERERDSGGHQRQRHERRPAKAHRLTRGRKP